MNHFQELALHKTKHNPAFSHTYFDPKFVHWLRTGSNKLQGFFKHVNSLTLAIQFRIRFRILDKSPVANAAAQHAWRCGRR